MRTRLDIHPLAAVQPPDPKAAFLTALHDAEEKSAALRDSLLAMMAASPTDPATWLDAMTDPKVAETFGALAILCGKDAEWSRAVVSMTLGALAQTAPAAIDAFSDAFADGQVRVEMACPCGQCNACDARAKMGDEIARASIDKALRAPKKSRILGPNGQKLS